ncbi:MAG: SDR family oxidoreductase [Planctomycetales bacterium]|nr:SDR family oxidoreductase [Planctomycetales bacterium]MCA9166528.1 SDR family oxidoreductase [Planctomycetales bacterium]
MSQLLAGRCAFVTGATHGVGYAIALSLARAGADVVLHGLACDAQALAARDACAACGVNAHLITGDLSGPTTAAVSHVFDLATNALPDIDLFVSNAGTYADVPFLEMTVESFERTWRLNVASHFFLIQAFARRWVERQVAGRVLLIGSINGRLAEPTHSAYDTSKGAIEMMVKTLCVELAPLNIRINGLAPGLFVTPLTASALSDPRALQWMQYHTPNGVVPGPEAAGEAAVFLLSDAAHHIHGHMLMVDGGMSIWQQPDPMT